MDPRTNFYRAPVPGGTILNTFSLGRLLRRISGAGTLLRYSASSISFQVANAVCNLLLLRWIEPGVLGLWQSLLLIGLFLQLIQGGAIHGLGRELPFSMGKADGTAVLELAGTGRAAVLVSVAVCLSGIPVGLLVFAEAVERWGTVAVLVGTGAQFYRLFLGATYRAAQAFEALARIQLVEALLAIVTLVLPILWGFHGLAARFVLQMAAGALLTHRFRPLKTVGPFSWGRLRGLYVVGLPIFLFGFLSDVGRSFPRLILLSLGGVEWVGLFAPASAVVGALWMIPSALGTYIYPQMSHRLGRTGDPASLWPMARATALWSFAIGLPVGAVTVAAIPFLVSHLAPAYTPSLAATQWVVGAGVFMGGSVIANALPSLKANRWMVTVVGIRLALLGALPFAGAKIIGGVSGVAVGMTAACFLDFVAVLFFVRLATRSPVNFSRRRLAPS